MMVTDYGGGNGGFVAVSSIDDDHCNFAAEEPGDHYSDCGESYSACNGLGGDHPQASGQSDKANSSGVNYAGLRFASFGSGLLPYFKGIACNQFFVFVQRTWMMDKCRLMTILEFLFSVGIYIAEVAANSAAIKSHSRIYSTIRNTLLRRTRWALPRA